MVAQSGTGRAPAGEPIRPGNRSSSSASSSNSGGSGHDRPAARAHDRQAAEVRLSFTRLYWPVARARARQAPTEPFEIDSAVEMARSLGPWDSFSRRRSRIRRIDRLSVGSRNSSLITRVASPGHTVGRSKTIIGAPTISWKPGPASSGIRAHEHLERAPTFLWNRRPQSDGTRSQVRQRMMPTPPPRAPPAKPGLVAAQGPSRAGARRAPARSDRTRWSREGSRLSSIAPSASRPPQGWPRGRCHAARPEFGRHGLRGGGHLGGDKALPQEAPCGGGVGGRQVAMRDARPENLATFCRTLRPGTCGGLCGPASLCVAARDHPKNSGEGGQPDGIWKADLDRPAPGGDRKVDAPVLPPPKPRERVALALITTRRPLRPPTAGGQREPSGRA